MFVDVSLNTVSSSTDQHPWPSHLGNRHVVQDEIFLIIHFVAIASLSIQIISSIRKTSSNQRPRYRRLFLLDELKSLQLSFEVIIVPEIGNNSRIDNHTS